MIFFILLRGRDVPIEIGGLNFVCLNSSKLFVGKLRAVYKSRTGDFDGGAF